MTLVVTNPCDLFAIAATTFSVGAVEADGETTDRHSRTVPPADRPLRSELLSPFYARLGSTAVVRRRLLNRRDRQRSEDPHCQGGRPDRRGPHRRRPPAICHLAVLSASPRFGSSAVNSPVTSRNEQVPAYLRARRSRVESGPAGSEQDQAKADVSVAYPQRYAQRPFCRTGLNWRTRGGRVAEGIARSPPFATDFRGGGSRRRGSGSGHRHASR